MGTAHKVFQIFKAGTHTAMQGQILSFTAHDLDMMAKVYDPALHRAPLVLGHPKHDDPAYGHVLGMFAKDGALFAQASVSADLEGMVKAGRYTRVSASLYPPHAEGNPVQGAWYVRHVGFLGAMPPAVKGMIPPAFAETGALCFCQGEECRAGICARPSFAENGENYDPESLHKHKTALQYQEACPALSYRDAVYLVDSIQF